MGKKKKGKRRKDSLNNKFHQAKGGHIGIDVPVAMYVTC